MKRIFSALFIAGMLMLQGTSNAQPLLVNEYFNGFVQKTEWVELLVTKNGLDVRGWSIRDFSSGGNPQAPLVFKNTSYWASLPAGLLIVITGDSAAFVTDTNKADYSIQIKYNDANYFSGTQFNIAVGSDAIQIRKGSGSDTTHIHGSSYGAGNSGSLPQPKAHFAGDLMGGGSALPLAGASLIFTKATIMDTMAFRVDGNLRKDTTGGTRGMPNDNTGNYLYIMSLRSPSISPYITRVDSFIYKTPEVIGVSQGKTIVEGSMGSGIIYIPGTDREFWMVTDRGPNGEAKARNGGNDAKVFLFPNYAPKIYRMKAEGDSLRMISKMTIKRPNGTDATGIPLPVGEGGGDELAWSDTNMTVITPDAWGMDSEGITVGPDNNFWVCDEYGVSVWHINRTTGTVINRYRPFAPSANNLLIDTVFKKRVPNRGLEGVTRTPNGKIYSMIQSSMANPNLSAGQNSRVHRILEINPANGQTRMFAYLHQAPTGNLRNRDWKMGDMVAINNNEFLVIEQAFRNGESSSKVYKINLQNATPITQETYGGSTPEQLDSAGLITNGIIPVQKSLYIDLLANGWPVYQDKPEGISILNDSTVAIASDNDYGIDAPLENGVIVLTGKKTLMKIFTVTGPLKIQNLVLTGTSNEVSAVVPDKFILAQNYPNPFNPVTRISYSIPKSSLVSVKIFNMLGQEVANLVNEVKGAGTYNVEFDGSGFSSGVYFYKLSAGDFTDTKKMILVK